MLMKIRIGTCADVVIVIVYNCSFFPHLGFYRFMRSEHKQKYDQMCKTLTGEGCGFQPRDAVKKKRPATKVDNNSHGNVNVKSNSIC